MDTQFLTSEGHQRVLSQLEFLRTVKRAEVAQNLREVVEAGDIFGNAVYEDVKGEGKQQGPSRVRATPFPFRKAARNRENGGR